MDGHGTERRGLAGRGEDYGYFLALSMRSKGAAHTVSRQCGLDGGASRQRETTQEDPKITCIRVFRITSRFVDLQGRPRTKLTVFFMAVFFMALYR